MSEDCDIPSLASEPTLFPSGFRTFPKIVFLIFTRFCVFLLEK